MIFKKKIKTFLSMSSCWFFKKKIRCPAADVEAFQSEGIASVAFYSPDPSSNWKQSEQTRFAVFNWKYDNVNIAYGPINASIKNGVIKWHQICWASLNCNKGWKWGIVKMIRRVSLLLQHQQLYSWRREMVPYPLQKIALHWPLVTHQGLTLTLQEGRSSSFLGQFKNFSRILRKWE